LRYITHILEYSSHFLYCGSLMYYARLDTRGVIKILAGYYFLAGLFIVKATHFKSPGESNLQVYSLLCVLTSFGLGAYLYTILIMRWKKALVLFFCILNGGFYLFNNIGAHPQVFDSIAYVLLSSTIVILIFMYLHQMLSKVSEDPLSMNFDFWFSSAQLIYFLGSFVIFLMYGYMTGKFLADRTMRNYQIALTWLWGVHNVLLFLSSLITLGSIVWISSHKKSPLS
jgi:hypothetical protein